MLTGYYPFFNVEEDKDIQKKVAGHRTAAIDPRFYQICEESRLAKIIEKMFAYYPEQRPEIVEVRNMLHDAIMECEKEEEEYRRQEEIREKEERQKLAEEEELARKEAQLRAEKEELEKKKAQRRIEEKEELANMEAADRTESVRKEHAETERANTEKATGAAAAAAEEKKR